MFDIIFLYKICFKIYAIERTYKKEKNGVPNREEILRNHVNFEESEKGDGKEDKLGLLKKSFTQGIFKKGGKNDGNINDKKDCVIF